MSSATTRKRHVLVGKGRGGATIVSPAIFLSVDLTPEDDVVREAGVEAGVEACVEAGVEAGVGHV